MARQFNHAKIANIGRRCGMFDAYSIRRTGNFAQHFCEWFNKTERAFKLDVEGDAQTIARNVLMFAYQQGLLTGGVDVTGPEIRFT